MKNYIFTLGLIFIGIGLKAQIYFEICDNGSSQFELFKKDDLGNLNCNDGGQAKIITLDGKNESIRQILSNSEGSMLGAEDIESTLNLTETFNKEKISVIAIQSRNSFGGYILQCNYKGKEGFLLYSILPINSH